MPKTNELIYNQILILAAGIWPDLTAPKCRENFHKTARNQEIDTGSSSMSQDRFSSCKWWKKFCICALLWLIISAVVCVITVVMKSNPHHEKIPDQSEPRLSLLNCERIESMLCFSIQDDVSSWKIFIKLIVHFIGRD